MLSMTTDFATDSGCPRPELERIAQAGFTHVHWCHHWATDVAYSESEILAIKRWLRELGLAVTDIHGSAGQEKAWCSAVEYERQAGVCLVENRLMMASCLNTDVVIMHLPSPLEANDARAWAAVRKTLDQMMAACELFGVAIALENGGSVASQTAIGRVLADYPADFLGVCYDCGHGNLAPDGIAWLDGVKQRLISVHLHDNDGSSDQHKIPFTGTVDWERLAEVLARSAYRKCLSFEVSMRNAEEKEPAAFLANAKAAGERFAAMVAAANPGH